MSCAFTYGYGNPIGQTAMLCDQQFDCWQQRFPDQDALQACLDTASQHQEDCIQECDPGDDGSEAASTREGCDDECNTTYDNCLEGCQETFDSCVAVCDPPGPGTECFTNCFEAKVECQQGCNDDWKECRYRCFLSYSLAIASIPLPDPRCLAACCTSDAGHYRSCMGQCTSPYNDAVLAADIEYWTCRSACPLEFWSGEGDGFVADGDCVNTCDQEVAIAKRLASDTQENCAFDCQFDFDNQWTDCAANSTCYHKCNMDLQPASYACFLEALYGGDAASVQACNDDVSERSMRCSLECCFDFRGRNEFDEAALECQITQMYCMSAIQRDCPVPGTAEGEPCHDSGSPECLEAGNEYQACVDNARTGCERAFKTCIQSIEAKNLAACGGCIGDISFPEDDSEGS